MIFTGDIAQPFVGASSYSIPCELKNKMWLGNLEGSLIEGRSKKGDVRGVYNDAEAIQALKNQIPFKAFNIANNHLLDAAEVKVTIDGIKHLAVSAVGAGCNLQDAKKAIVVTDVDGNKYCILSFGWENIQCVPAFRKTQGVNPYTRDNVIECAVDALKHDTPVVCFMHWNYELERYPQPYDRQLAMDLIDMGVAAVIGCHAHRVQPIEFYKGKPIVYGLGNFLFCQGHYFDGLLKFPKFCEKEYVFEITNGGRSLELHHFSYDLVENKLEYVKSETITQETEFDGKAEFTGYTAAEYESWFKQHRVQKKLLPIFHAHESTVSYALKSGWIKVRGRLINLLTKINLKSANRADRE